MRFTPIFLSCSIAMVAASCGGNKTVDSREPAAPMAPPQPVAQNRTLAAQAPAPAQSPAKTAQAPAANNDTPAPPRDAQFTIVCKVIPGPGHVQLAVNLKNDL